ncbi:MAG: trimethylamine methyltransferase family protein [Desulforhopalus sp.]
MSDDNIAVPRLSLLSEQQCEKIVQAAYQILETTGINIDHDAALRVYKKLGCRVDNNRVRITSELIQPALESVPEMVTIHDRMGEPVMHLGGSNTYYGPGLTNTFFIDPFTGERRDAIGQDVASTAIVTDALENIDFAMGLTGITDCPPHCADIIEMGHLLKNTSKPLVGWSINKENSKHILKMLEVVAGDLELFRKKPFAVMYAGSCINGLSHAENEIDKLFFWIEKGVPVIYTGSGQFGITSPLTMAGSLAQAMAESLSIILLTQSIRPGAPFFSSCSPMTMDMKSMVTCYGAPESCLAYVAEADLLHYLKIPIYGIAGASESKTDDGQAAIENTVSISSTLFSGNNLVHDLGFLESGMTGSLVQLVISDEMIGMLRHMKKGIEINDETLALDTIDRLGPGGSFLMEEETMLNFRKVLWEPKLFDRKRFHDWEKNDSGSLEKRAAKKVLEILDQHKPVPLADTAVAEIDRIITACRNFDS